LVSFLGALFIVFNLNQKPSGKPLHDIEKYHSPEENSNGDSSATNNTKAPAPLISISPSSSLQKLNVQFTT